MARLKSALCLLLCEICGAKVKLAVHWFMRGVRLIIGFGVGKGLSYLEVPYSGKKEPFTLDMNVSRYVVLVYTASPSETPIQTSS